MLELFSLYTPSTIASTSECFIIYTLSSCNGGNVIAQTELVDNLKLKVGYGSLINPHILTASNKVGDKYKINDTMSKIIFTIPTNLPKNG